MHSHATSNGGNHEDRNPFPAPDPDDPCQSGHAVPRVDRSRGAQARVAKGRRRLVFRRGRDRPARGRVVSTRNDRSRGQPTRGDRRLSRDPAPHAARVHLGMGGSNQGGRRDPGARRVQECGRELDRGDPDPRAVHEPGQGEGSGAGLDPAPRAARRRVRARYAERTGMSGGDTIREYFDRLGRKQDWASLLADDFVFTSCTSPVRQIPGKAGYVEGTRRFFSMITSVEVRHLLVEGDRACALTRYQLQRPDGSAFASDVAEIFSVSDGKIRSLDIYFDTAPYPK